MQAKYKIVIATNKYSTKTHAVVNRENKRKNLTRNYARVKMRKTE